MSWSQDGTRLFAGGPSHVGEKPVIRSISILTGAVQPVTDDGVEAEASPDGKQIVYVDGASRTIELAGSQGESPRALFEAPSGEVVASVHWLPGGQRIGYLRGVNGAPEATIETRDLHGGDARSILEERTESIAFAPDGRVFFTTKDAAPQPGASLWTVAIDPATGARVGGPVRLSQWAGAASAQPLTISSDGRRLALTKAFPQSDVYRLDLDAAGTSVRSTRQLTTDTLADWPSQWSRDGSSFLFYSNRNGTLHAFRQPVEREAPEPLISGAAHVRSPQMTSDGHWIVYVEMTSGPDAARVMRVPASGGPAERVLTVSSVLATSTLQFFGPLLGTGGVGARSFPDIRCPSRGDGSCVLAEARPQPQQARSSIVFSSFDPASGRARELAAVPLEYETAFWDLSPDGSTIAFGQFAWGGGDQLTLLRAATSEQHVVRVSDFKNLSDLAWASDGQSLFATTETIRAGEVLHVMLDGRARLLRAFPSQSVCSPRPSPDGRSLLLGVVQTNSNAWIIER